ncbi:MAG: lytic transglycosylase domain-containing protein [Pseudomonadota bacterium]
MPLSPALVMALAAQCAPGVAPETMLAVARAESGLNPWAIGVNGAAAQRPKPNSAGEAAALARDLIARGRDIDLGLAQINVRNLRRLGLSVEAAFDPCANLAASARVLRDGYARGRGAHGPGQAALRVAFSVYNTGDLQRGFRNGYVARVVAHAGPRADRATPASAQLAIAPPDPPAWDVFGRAAAVRSRAVFSASGATP